MHFSSVFICPASLCFLVGAVKSLSHDNILELVICIQFTDLSPILRLMSEAVWFFGADSLTEGAGRRVMPMCGPVS